MIAKTLSQCAVAVCLMALAAVAICLMTLAGCSTLPERDPQLEDARIAHDAARDDANVQALAALEYKRADDEYRRAEAAWQNHDDPVEVDHLAYLAQRRAEIALATARLRASEAVIANATAERNRIQLEARTREANLAQRDAQIAQLQAEVTRQRALEAQRDAAIAEQRANASLAEASAARRDAIQSHAVAQSLALELAELQAKSTNRGMVITLGDVLFDTGSARLREPGQRAVDKLAAFLREYPQRTVAIEGFTDNVGSETYNQELSERRADAIRDALLALGISVDRISIHGYGKAYPIASNGDPTGRQLNRRVEVVISDEDGRIPPRNA